MDLKDGRVKRASWDVTSLGDILASRILEVWPHLETSMTWRLAWDVASPRDILASRADLEAWLHLETSTTWSDWISWKSSHSENFMMTCR